MIDHANELRRHARKIPHPQGETPGVMLRAADEIERLRAKVAEMEKQEPVAWMLNCQTLGGDTGWILSWTQSGAGLCNRLQGDENEKRLYALPGAPAQPAPSLPEGWKLVPTAESRHPGIYKMLHVLHAVYNTPGASEWESYAAFLAASPEFKP